MTKPGRLMRYIWLTLALMVSVHVEIQAQSIEIAEITVKAGEVDRMNTPASASLEGLPIGLQAGRQLQLYEMADGGEEAVASQLDADGYEKTLRWIVRGETPAGTRRHYVLRSE